MKSRGIVTIVAALAAAVAALPVGAAPTYSATRLGTLGGNGGSGNGINAAGQVTGFSYVTKWTPPNPDPHTQWHAFVYSGGVMRDLGTFGGNISSGNAINASGQVAGFASLNNLPYPFAAEHAFLYSNGVLTDLGTLGGQSSYGFGINASGQVVGGADTAGNGQHAFLYSDGTMYDLNLLVTGLAGTLLTNAPAINDSGQIVANGCSESLICQAFRLDPSPAAPPSVKVAAIEFRYPAFDHYFFTANAAEIAALDSGMFPGWVRTGEGFNVYSGASLGTATVCRFFSASFAPKSSHFYSQDAGECSIVNQSGAWQFEGDVMGIPVADALGNCAAGTQPVYRLYNNGQGGAPAHRFTTSLAIRSQMLAQGWISEGYGNDGVIMCSPI